MQGPNFSKLTAYINVIIIRHATLTLKRPYLVKANLKKLLHSISYTYFKAFVKEHQEYVYILYIQS